MVTWFMVKHFQNQIFVTFYTKIFFLFTHLSGGLETYDHGQHDGQWSWVMRMSFVCVDATKLLWHQDDLGPFIVDSFIVDFIFVTKRIKAPTTLKKLASHPPPPTTEKRIDNFSGVTP